MRKNYARAAAGFISVLMIGGCYTTVVDKGPPKIGQTVERPHPVADQIAQNHANQVQEDTSTPSTVVPGENTEPTPATGNSIFSNGVENNTTTTVPKMTIGNGNANPTENGSVPQTANPPEGSPLSPTNSSAPIKDGG